ncbi:MAG: glucose-6-phosphate isomerase [Erysipelotrichaceae bacterium]|jgi:glucose-6-phosphate isomerase|nr:glucose-6-phosphate isomerase [Erysipelotrichaceae bacterium]MCB9499943.1 glucose-6-phosphate isomerase [Erysipelotrichaceae bacterium]
MKIEVGFDYLGKGNLVNFEKYQKKVTEINETIKNRTGLGSDFLGWYDYPSRIDEKVIKSIENKAKEFRENYDVLVVCGIGGSYLGPRAAIEALNGIPSSDKMEIMYLGNSLDSNYVDSCINYLKNKKFCVCVISKSGTTTETAVSFRILKNLLKQQMGNDFNKAIVAITDETNGSLRAEVKSEHYVAYDLPRDIGGRYSVMTAVGLFPMAVAGINIREYIDGLKQGQIDFDNDKIKENSAYQYAVERFYLYTKKNYPVEMLAMYEPRLTNLKEWRKQLFDETEGKDGKAVLCASCVFTTDLHSLGQFIQEGSKILYETIVYVSKPNKDIEVPLCDDDSDGINYLAGKKLSFINHKAYVGTLKAHSESGNVPNITITLDEMNAKNLGYFFYFFMKACAMSAYLNKVNPFNQPGVEVYKKNMFHLLGKKGY